jgi:DNA polymerase-3 subunit delta'
MAKQLRNIEYQNTVGQKEAKNLLSSIVKTEKVAHALLFSGPQGTGKLCCGIETAMALLCQSKGNTPCYKCLSCTKALSANHPDLTIAIPFLSESLFKRMKKNLVPEEFPDMDYRQFYSYSIEQTIKQPYSPQIPAGNPTFLSDTVQNIQEETDTKPTESSYKIFILYGIEAMNATSANRLLKTLEEPPPYIIFILISNHPYNVLPTIRSRCQAIRFMPLEDSLIADFLQKKSGLGRREADRISVFADGSIYNAISLIDTDYSDILTLAKEFFHVVTARNHETLLDYHEKVQSVVQSGDQMRLLLGFVLILCNKIYILKFSTEANLLNNKEFNEIQICTERWNQSLFYYINKEIKNSIKALELNVNFHRNFLSLLLKLISN